MQREPGAVLLMNQVNNQTTIRFEINQKIKLESGRTFELTNITLRIEEKEGQNAVAHLDIVNGFVVD
jgi:hypothetical protein